MHKNIMSAKAATGSGAPVELKKGGAVVYIESANSANLTVIIKSLFGGKEFTLHTEVITTDGKKVPYVVPDGVDTINAEVTVYSAGDVTVDITQGKD